MEWCLKGSVWCVVMLNGEVDELSCEGMVEIEDGMAETVLLCVGMVQVKGGMVEEEVVDTRVVDW